MPYFFGSHSEGGFFGNYQSILLTIIFVLLAFNITFNYTLAVCISPGKLKDYYSNDERVSIILRFLYFKISI